jgi:hypothetical protein
VSCSPVIEVAVNRQERIAELEKTMTDAQALEACDNGSGIVKEAGFLALKTRETLAGEYLRRSDSRYNESVAYEAKKAERTIEQLEAAKATLLAAGWKLEYSSDFGSLYFAKGEHRIRVADHYVPQTAAREHMAKLGCFVWNFDAPQLVVPSHNWESKLAALISELA